MFIHHLLNFRELQQELNTAAVNLNDASSEVVTSIRSSSKLAESSKNFGNAFNDLMGVSMEMAGQTKVKLTHFRNYLSFQWSFEKIFLYKFVYKKCCDF